MVTPAPATILATAIASRIGIEPPGVRERRRATSPLRPGRRQSPRPRSLAGSPRALPAAADGRCRTAAAERRWPSSERGRTADAAHNFTRRADAGRQALSGPRSGPSATLATSGREVPHEVGDVAMLMQARLAVGRHPRAGSTALGALLGTLVGRRRPHQLGAAPLLHRRRLHLRRDGRRAPRGCASARPRSRRSAPRDGRGHRACGSLVLGERSGSRRRTRARVAFT